jgi:hypothetical protein
MYSYFLKYLKPLYSFLYSWSTASSITSEAIHFLNKNQTKIKNCHRLIAFTSVRMCEASYACSNPCQNTRKRHGRTLVAATTLTRLVVRRWRREEARYDMCLKNREHERTLGISAPTKT